ncbi:hypothetical protein H8K90_16050 [Winogradskyella echinorum]|uniref:Uncharacterized protein n=1 Tax=Winogradskyella echinorum TaxID=538189 RepID=A0ABR6Y5H6_9FLAO|nr:DUF6090 family protein [Winogradskyella echinorum]MBC3847909.1 hypothetical protein [Winogradskyella echinorum]MBC5752257.1 hypothetical protein [Winogradskyella echinorum]
MIKFFRHIRKNLLSEGKTGKYFKYAIGEIVLVVIGILIALQINNFNNNRQEIKIEQEYLLSLQTEYETNLEKINLSLQKNKERVNAVEDMLTLFDANVLDTTSDKAISDILYSVFSGDATFQPSKGVLTDVISSGNLNVIKNKKLRQRLASFESKLDFLKLMRTAIKDLKNKLKNQLNNNGSIRKLLIDRGRNFENKSISDSRNNRQIFSSIEFENNLLDYYLTISAANGPRVFGGIKEQIEQILVEIDLEINK